MSLKTKTLVSGVNTIDYSTIYSPDAFCNEFNIIGSPVLAANTSIIISGTPVKGSSIVFNYTATPTVGIYNVAILGSTLPAELTNNKFIAWCVYSGSAWIVTFTPSSDQTEVFNGTTIKDATITTSKVADLAITTALIDNLAVTAAKIANNTITATQIAASTITATELANNSVGTAEIVANAVTLAKMATQADSTVLGNNSGGVAVPTALSKTDLRSIINYVAPQTVLTVPVSFETGEQCDNTITIPFDCTLDDTYISAYSTKAIAATDNATITLEKNGVAITGGLITFTASAAINTAGTVTAFSPVTFAAGDTLNLVSAKVTAGGKAIVSIPLVLI